MANDTPALILAGGQSRRMGGGDKPLVDLAGKPLLAHVAGRLTPQAGAIALSANGDPTRFANFGLAVLADTVAGFRGPLAGILAGMEWALEDPASTRLVTVAGDTPFYPVDLVDRLADAVRDRPDAIAFATAGGRNHPVFALWPLGLVEDLRAVIEAGSNLRVTDFLARHAVESVDFPLVSTATGDIDPFFNVNTPEDLALARQLAPELAR